MMTILVLGAGRSSGSLIRYLLQHAADDNYTVVVADVSAESAAEKTGHHPSSSAISLNIENTDERESAIKSADLVISLLPPALHILAARDCLQFRKPFVSASYVSAEIASLHDDVSNAGLLFLNECGLDPGVDHMSAMEVIHRLQKNGAELTAFRSYTGGLIAPESNDNPWGYKFTWNPRNVILAGQGTAKYIHNGHYRYIPYNRLFSEFECIVVDGAGVFDGYANRDSLAYRKHYSIENVPTLIRGTLRQENFCKAWQIFVSLGITDDSFIMEDSEHLTYADFLDAFIPSSTEGFTVKERLANFIGNDPGNQIMNMIESTGLLNDALIGLPDATPAQILQQLLQSKWVLKEGDKDMVVMQHVFNYNLGDKAETLYSSLVVKGETQVHTAMALTVGLPLGICARKMLKGEFKLTGVHIPVYEEIYKPVLHELQQMGIVFKEKLI